MGVRRWMIAGVGAVTMGVPGGNAPAAAVPAAEVQQTQLERIGVLIGGATPGRPAHFGLQEEQDRLARSIDLAAQLEYVDGVFADATPGSPAQFRAREGADALREVLRRLGAG